MEKICVERPTSQKEQFDLAPEDGYWTTAEAAEFLGKSERSIRRHLQSGALKGCKIAGPNGLIWRVEPISDVASSTTNAVDELVAEYGAKEALIEKLNQQVDDLKEQLARNNALYITAMQRIEEYERKESVKNCKSPQVKTKWWQVFKLSEGLGATNASKVIHHPQC